MNLFQRCFMPCLSGIITRKGPSTIKTTSNLSFNLHNFSRGNAMARRLPMYRPPVTYQKSRRHTY